MEAESSSSGVPSKVDDSFAKAAVEARKSIRHPIAVVTTTAPKVRYWYLDQFSEFYHDYIATKDEEKPQFYEDWKAKIEKTAESWLAEQKKECALLEKQLQKYRDAWKSYAEKERSGVVTIDPNDETRSMYEFLSQDYTKLGEFQNAWTITIQEHRECLSVIESFESSFEEFKGIMQTFIDRTNK